MVVGQRQDWNPGLLTSDPRVSALGLVADPQILGRGYKTNIHQEVRDSGAHLRGTKALSRQQEDKQTVTPVAECRQSGI